MVNRIWYVSMVVLGASVYYLVSTKMMEELSSIVLFCVIPIAGIAFMISSIIVFFEMLYEATSTKSSSKYHQNSQTTHLTREQFWEACALGGLNHEEIDFIMSRYYESFKDYSFMQVIHEAKTDWRKQFSSRFRK